MTANQIGFRGRSRSLVPPRRPNPGPRLGTGLRRYFVAIVFLVSAALLYLWGNVKTVSQRDAMAGLQREGESLLRVREKLEAELAGLRQSTRIRARAEALGLVFPEDPPSNLYLSDIRPTNEHPKAKAGDFRSLNPDGAN